MYVRSLMVDGVWRVVCSATVGHTAEQMFRFWMWPSNMQKDVVDRSRKTTMETTWSKLIRPNPIQSNPIRSKGTLFGNKAEKCC